MLHLTICSCHVTYTFQSESSLYSCLNVKELLTRSRCKICLPKQNLMVAKDFFRTIKYNDCNWTWTHNHLIRKWTLNHLAKLAKWLSCVVSTCLYGAFECMFLSCHVCISEWIHTHSCLNVKELLAQSRCKICLPKQNLMVEKDFFGTVKYNDCNWTRTRNHLVRKQTLNHLAKLAKWFSCVVSIYLYGAFDYMFLSCHIYISEWTLYSCLKVKELLAWSRCKICSLSECNWTRTHNHLVRKGTLNHLAKLVKWLSFAVSFYLCFAFDCMFLSCHVHIS